MWSRHQPALLRRLAAGERVNDQVDWENVVEARCFRDDATDCFAPSMRQRIDVASLYRRALRAMPETIEGQPPLAVAGSRLFTLDELLTE
jgi:hypothetical protein